MPDDIKISAEDMLNYLVAHGKIDLGETCAEVRDMRIDEIIKDHDHKIWKGKNGYYYTYFTEHDGKRRLLKRKTRRELANLLQEAYELKDKVTIKDLYPVFKEYKKSCGVKQKTLDLYDYNYYRFLDGDPILRKNMKDIEVEDLEAFIFRVFDNHSIKYKALSEMFCVVKNVFKLACKKKYLSRNVCEFIELKDYSKRCKSSLVDPETRVLDREDCMKLLDRLREDFETKPDYIPSYAVEFMLLTGMRIGEVAFLQWEHIKEDKGYILICGSEKYVQSTKEHYDDVTKTGKLRHVPLTQPIKAFLDHLHDVEEAYGFLTDFVFSDADGRCHLLKLRSCTNHKCMQAGIKAKGANALRRTFNSILKTNGVSSTIASSILGHSADVNEKYYTYDVSNIERKKDLVEDAYKALFNGQL